MMSLKLLCEDTTSFQKLKKTIDIIAFTYEVLCAFGEDFIVFVWSFVIFCIAIGEIFECWDDGITKSWLSMCLESLQTQIIA